MLLSSDWNRSDFFWSKPVGIARVGGLEGFAWRVGSLASGLKGLGLPESVLGVIMYLQLAERTERPASSNASTLSALTVSHSPALGEPENQHDQ